MRRRRERDDDEHQLNAKRRLRFGSRPLETQYLMSRIRRPEDDGVKRLVDHAAGRGTAGRHHPLPPGDGHTPSRMTIVGREGRLRRDTVSERPSR